MKNWELEIKTNHEYLKGQSVIKVKNGLWYKYNIDECESLDDGNYMIYSNTLISVDGKLKTE
jgi:hypothetical protein